MLTMTFSSDIFGRFGLAGAIALQLLIDFGAGKISANVLVLNIVRWHVAEGDNEIRLAPSRRAGSLTVRVPSPIRS